MPSANQSQINRLMQEIANLRKTDASEAAKEAALLSKINKASDSAGKTKSASIAASKLKEMERGSKDLSAVQKKRADIAGKIAGKAKSLASYEEKQSKEDAKDRQKAATEQKKLMAEREAHERRITSEVQRRTTMSKGSNSARTVSDEAHDFFISHASEDKVGFVRELAEALQSQGAKVWYDEYTLKVGDSLRRNIDRGLANSRFGVVVLSEAFFRKEWTNKELDGLVALESQGGTRILPIWHKVSKDEVTRYSPTLADKVALNTSLKTVTEIASDLLELLS